MPKGVYDHAGRTLPLDVRLEQYIFPVPECGCWVWMGSLDENGYGRTAMKCDDGVYRPRKVHIVLHEQKHGPIPPDKVRDHLCRVRCCVNPDHLEVVTQAENKRRGLGGIANRKFTDEQISAIRSDQRPQHVIAAEYGMDQPWVSRVKNHKAYTKVMPW